VYEEERAPEVDESIKRACVKTLEIVFGKEALEGGAENIFDGQVGLANFYAPGDTLNGHVDDAEMNLNKPIASLSLGLPAIFLLGQQSKALEPVTALIVRSGDAIVLSGESRTMFHGVPRVFSDGEAVGSTSFQFPDALARAFSEVDDDAFLLDFAKQTRINLSLRDVR
jgi:alkylated DNA repair protein alkB family protein 1